MKITAVKTLVVNAEMRNWVFVKVETDTGGVVWLGRSVVGVEDARRGRRGRGFCAHANR